MGLHGNRTFLSVLFSLLLLPLVVQGAQQETAEYEAPEIVVTATRTERAVKDLSATVSIINRQEIEASNSNSCTDILASLPGVFIEKTGAFGRADVDIRGLGGKGTKVMVLVDGRPVKMGLYGCTVTHSLPLNNVERIEVVRGPLSVLYGSDALGGVINIITRKPTRPMEADYTFSYGTYNTSRNQLRGGMTRGPLSFYATGDKRKSSGHLPHSAYDGSDFTARLDYAVAGDWEATFTGKYFDGHKEEPLRATDPDTILSDTWNDYKRGAVDLTLTGSWFEWSIMGKLYRNLGDHEFSDGWRSTDFTTGTVLNGSGTVFAGNELTLGMEFRQQGGERLSAPPGKWDKAEYALFFHDEQVIWSKLILALGARYNWDEISGTQFCPQVGLVFHPRKGTTLRGAVNKGFRSPQLSDLYLLPPSNDKLKPEEVWNYEVGLAQQIGDRLDIDIVGYRMKGENLIQVEKGKFQNTWEFELNGLEFGLRAQVNKSLSGRFYYTYLDPGEKTQGRPGDKLDLALQYQRKRTGVSLSAQYVADYFAADNRTDRIDDYLVVNTKLSYSLNQRAKAFLAVDNLLDADYQIYTDIPGGIAGRYWMPGRTVSTGLTLGL